MKTLSKIERLMASAAPWEGELVEGTAMICRGIEMGSANAKLQFKVKTPSYSDIVHPASQWPVPLPVKRHLMVPDGAMQSWCAAPPGWLVPAVLAPGG